MRVSIVITNYNYAAFVGDAIASALAQTHPDTEVIVVDDGSTDGSLAVIGLYADRIRCIMQPNGGQGAAYNSGWRAATGRIVIFLDADDWLYPEAAARSVQAWRAGITKVQFALDMVDRAGAPLGRQVPRHMHDRDALDLLRRFGAYGSPPASGNAFCADFLRRVMPVDAALWRTAADSVPILLAPACGEIVTLPDALGAYRQHRDLSDGSLISNNAPVNLWHELQRIGWTKDFIERTLPTLGAAPLQPLSFAPWEARLAVLCARFGGPPPADAPLPAPRALMRWALDSLWQWPASPWRVKAMVSAWMLAVWCLPEPFARRVAGLHRRAVGAPKPLTGHTAGAAR